MLSVFISYKRNHPASEEAVSAIEESLGREFEFLKDRSIKLGDRWSKELYGWLLGCHAGIVIVSDEANAADWCRREWALLAARNEVAGLPVFPIHVGGKITATGILDDLQASKWPNDGLGRLRVALGKLPSRLASPADLVAAHRAWLRWQYCGAKVLGQEPYALSDVYVETECGKCLWHDLNEGKGTQRRDPFQEVSGGRANLVDTVLASFSDPDFRDLIVVQAGPGSGKSAFTLRLANELMDRGFTPIVVRFRDLRLAIFPNIAELIEDAMRIGDTADVSPAPSGSVVSYALSTSHQLRDSESCGAVFIFDGWDEVSLTGNASYQAQLHDWLPKLRQFFVDRPGVPVRLVLTGRPSSEVGQSGVLHRTTPVLTIRPMRPEQLRQYVETMARHLSAAAVGGQPASWSIDAVRLEPVFQKYAEWFSSYAQGKQGAPNSSADVLGNPLLAYLSLRVIAESDQKPETLLSESTALYHALIEVTVANAGKARGAGFGGTVHRGGDNLRRLLHEVASTISILRSEAVSYTELKLRFEDLELPIERKLLGDWTNTEKTENALRELVINFYFKGGHTALGCEFLHKSFREYLFAEAIVFALEDTAVNFEEAGVKDYTEDFREGTAAFAASRRLSYLLAPQWLSKDVERHLAWLIQRAAADKRELWLQVRSLVTEVYAWWAEGVHLRHQPRRSRSKGRWLPPFVDQLFEQTVAMDPEARDTLVRSTALDAHLGHALLVLTAKLHAVLLLEVQPPAGRRAAYQTHENGRIHFKPGGRRFMRALIARLDAEGWRSGAGLQDVPLGPVDLRGSDLLGVRCDLTNFCGALLAGVDIRLVIATSADFSAADLRRANLMGARLMGARFEGADLRRAQLTGTDLTHAGLQGVNLQGANLQGADLQGADLQGANLHGADPLQGVDLKNASLQDANLHGADLEHADLRHANLRHANLRGANLRHANLQGANLRHANLQGAYLDHADMRDADLQDARLDSASLTGARLSRAALRSAGPYDLIIGSLSFTDDEPSQKPDSDGHSPLSPSSSRS